jgi:diguanylate cyclase (GGDEF)-like protein/PAS domain S-box-containing protein
MFKFTIIAVTLFITTAINCIAAVISWQRQKSRRGLHFAIAMLGITLWTLAGGFDYAATSIAMKVFFAKLEYLGYHIALVFFALFAVSYAGYDELLQRKSVRAFLWIVPTSNVLLAWTNDWHGWLWTGFTRSDFGDNTVIFEHGPAFLWVSASGYLLVFIIILSLWLASRRGPNVLRQQARLLFFASLLPLVGNLIYLFQPREFSGVDWSSVLYSVSSLLFLWALYGTYLLDLAPIAREKLIDSISDGMVVVDMQNRIVDINRPAARMIGLTPEQSIGRYLGEFVPLAQSLAEQPPQQEIRTEVEVGDAEKLYFDVLVSPLFENPQTMAGHLIIFRDITNRKQNELRLLQLNQAVEQSPTSIVITDPGGIITYVNPQFTVLTGYGADEAIGKNPRILKSGQTPGEVYPSLWRTIQAGKVWRGEFLNRKKSGDLYWEDATIAPVFGHDGKIINFIAVKVDVTDRKFAEKALKELAATDPLTGIFNRRHFFGMVNTILADAARYAHPVAIMVCDIDLFKRVNDIYGHKVGDLALQHLVNGIRSTTRAADIAARFGGDEFTILLPETDGEQAVHLADRLHAYLAAHPVPAPGTRFFIKISVGITSIPAQHETISIDAMLERADRALYQAKESGRNQTRIYGQ